MAGYAPVYATIANSNFPDAKALSARARNMYQLSSIVGLTLALLHAVNAQKPLPDNLKDFVAHVRNNGVGECQNPLSGGFHSKTNDGDDYVYCGDYYDSNGIVYLQGPDGQLVNMDIDCDGDQRPNRPGNDGRCGPSNDTQNQTAFGYIAANYPGSNIPELNSYVHTYVVFGNQQTHPSFHPQKYGIHPLSVMAVVCGDKLVYGVWGDTNGNDGQPLVGETSLALATFCFGKKMNGNNGHSPNNVMYIAFKGSEAVPGKSANWNAQSAKAFEKSISALGDKLVKTIPHGHD